MIRILIKKRGNRGGAYFITYEVEDGFIIDSDLTDFNSIECITIQEVKDE